jgi:hypothetical protein
MNVQKYLPVTALFLPRKRMPRSSQLLRDNNLNIRAAKTRRQAASVRPAQHAASDGIRA